MSRQDDKRARRAFNVYAVRIARRGPQFDIIQEIRIARAHQRWLELEIRSARRG